MLLVSKTQDKRYILHMVYIVNVYTQLENIEAVENVLFSYSGKF